MWPVIARLVTNVLISSSGTIAKALAEAFKQAAKNGSVRGAGAKMSLDEARMILNTKKDTPLEEMYKSYGHMFRQNSPEKGSSFYIQSKIYRAREALDVEYEKQDPEGFKAFAAEWQAEQDKIAEEERKQKEEEEAKKETARQEREKLREEREKARQAAKEEAEREKNEQ
eukprot:TRINITY_DN808_c0_g4_i1.p2 TRINITY_DN808_c0_g4~~TRINITY_DN808_c0_g4_i1.p2  ORF type:complete len:170 (+),score=62.08 TRINITY_DN808_c0_g4_i1:277-786(+)